MNMIAYWPRVYLSNLDLRISKVLASTTSLARSFYVLIQLGKSDCLNMIVIPCIEVHVIVIELHIMLSASK